MTRIDTVKATIIRAQTSANYDGTDDIVAALMPLIREAQADAWDEGWTFAQRVARAMGKGIGDPPASPYRDEAP